MVKMTIKMTEAYENSQENGWKKEEAIPQTLR